MCISWGHDGGLQEPALGSSTRSARVPKGLGNLMGSVGSGWPTLGADTVERLHVTRKIASRAARYQGQCLSCEWVVKTNIPRPCDPTHGMRYRVLAVHGGPCREVFRCRASEFQCRGQATDCRYTLIYVKASRRLRTSMRTVWLLREYFSSPRFGGDGIVVAPFAKDMVVEVGEGAKFITFTYI
ncbi:UNVERIFIED_CONTAM: hypothetical protein Sindi_2846600 [Sesamum indicum]